MDQDLDEGVDARLLARQPSGLYNPSAGKAAATPPTPPIVFVFVLLAAAANALFGYEQSVRVWV